MVANSTQNTLINYPLWTHKEWFESVDSIQKRFDEIENEILSQSLLLDIASLSSDWQIETDLIKILNTALFSEGVQPCTKSETIQKLFERASEVHSIAKFIIFADLSIIVNSQLS